jgi:hypothetical protein
LRTSCWIVGNASPSSAPQRGCCPTRLAARMSFVCTYLACGFPRPSDPRSRACRRHRGATRPVSSPDDEKGRVLRTAGHVLSGLPATETTVNSRAVPASDGHEQLDYLRLGHASKRAVTRALLVTILTRTSFPRPRRPASAERAPRQTDASDGCRASLPGSMIGVGEVRYLRLIYPDHENARQLGGGSPRLPAPDPWPADAARLR